MGENLYFAEIIDRLVKEGESFARRSWEAYGTFIRYDEEQGAVMIHENNDGLVFKWSPSKEALLASDWRSV